MGKFLALHTIHFCDADGSQVVVQARSKDGRRPSSGVFDGLSEKQFEELSELGAVRLATTAEQEEGDGLITREPIQQVLAPGQVAPQPKQQAAGSQAKEGGIATLQVKHVGGGNYALVNDKGERVGEDTFDSKEAAQTAADERNSAASLLG